jgi:hypothetical protein
MNKSIAPGLVPPRVGLEKEEPELAQEEDIPTSDKPGAPDETEDEAPRDVERK